MICFVVVDFFFCFALVLLCGFGTYPFSHHTRIFLEFLTRKEELVQIGKVLHQCCFECSTHGTFKITLLRLTKQIDIVHGMNYVR